MAAKRVLKPLREAAVLLPFLLVSSVSAGNFDGIVIFGDSLSDPGNHFIEFGTTALQPFAPIPDASYAIGGHHFSNGATWVEQVAAALHMPTSGNPALRAPGVFTNYAVGRARARSCLSVPAVCPSGQYPFGEVDLSFEVSRFLRDVAGRAPSSDLYVISIGDNDVNDALIALQTDTSGATSAAIVQAAVAAETSSIQALYAAGARLFFIPSVANLAFTPYVRSLGPVAESVTSQIVGAYNAALDQTVPALAAGLAGTHFIRYDVNPLFLAIEAHPAAFGLTDAQNSCLTFNVIGNAICATPNRYLFWDGIHPTTAGHSIVATSVLQVLLAQWASL